jgi:DNA-directed RNA polymerase specialized sigma24 family protein
MNWHSVQDREQFWCDLTASYERRINAYVRRIPCTGDERANIVADTWVLAVDHERELSEATDPWVVLGGVLREACASNARSSRREAIVHHHRFLDPAENDRACATDDKRLWAGINRAMISLTEKQRLAVAYRYLWGWPYWAVAAAIETSEAAARVQVSRGLANLQKNSLIVGLAKAERQW